MLHKDFSQVKESAEMRENDRITMNISPLENRHLDVEDEKSQQQIDEINYFLEKYPGKLCCLCNLGELSLLGQGELLRLEQKEIEKDSNSLIGKDDANMFVNNYNALCSPRIENRKTKTINKCKNWSHSSDNTDELDKIGHITMLSFNSIQDEHFYYVHKMCASWSLGVFKNSDGILQNLENVVTKSLKRKCSYCNKYGASVSCRMSCTKMFHLPCATASGCFLIINNFTTFCNDHFNQIFAIYTDTNIVCRHCYTLDDISKLLACCACGDHYHTTCIGLVNLPGTRCGWQCSSCCKCQICKQPDNNDGRLLKCEQCHKIYHAYCLRPVISSVPKFGWKCRRCRICSDCGARTPGAGASSRWHAHYTICDSCYQQRNKGFSCPICYKAYRAAAYKEMVKCSRCSRFVHGKCDSEADLFMYHFKKENDPDYEYICPACKSTSQSSKYIKNANQIRFLQEEESCIVTDSTLSAVVSLDNFYKNLETETDDNWKLVSANSRGKPFDSFKLLKKKMSFKDMNKVRPKFTFHKRTNFHDFGRKRGPKGKLRNLILGSSGSQSNTDRNSNRIVSDPASENKLVLCSAKDKYVLTQDICAMCGSIGIDREGCLISCSQCGQCYHPYCVNIKVSKVILLKGWRCLDCTVCEGCGQKNDEARLILCDECDISYHIYCINPPLDTVPHGNWKCKWCAMCQKCGSKTPGKNSDWKNNYSECGPCFSKSTCCCCSITYTDNELIIQCSNCERWLHGTCDTIKSEEEAQRHEFNYTCILCRPKDTPLPRIVPSTISLTPIKHHLNVVGNETFENNTVPTETIHYIDGVCMNDHGLQQIKSLQTDIKKKRKLKAINGEQLKDFGITATIESVVAGTSLASQGIHEVFENHKDGMTWAGTETSVPDGFSLLTNDEGRCFLRKKRQRNLQKLGIGGFIVKNRSVRKDFADKYSGAGNGDTINVPDAEKRKRTARRKIKSKLFETYPTYLQEAFFGKSLLDLEKSSYLESDSCESSENMITGTSNDIFVNLSLEENKFKNNSKKNAPSYIAENKKGIFDETQIEDEKSDSFTEIKFEITTNKNDFQPNAEKNNIPLMASVDYSSTSSSNSFFKEQDVITQNQKDNRTEDTRIPSCLLDENKIPPEQLEGPLSNAIVSSFSTQVLTKEEKRNEDEKTLPSSTLSLRTITKSIEPPREEVLNLQNQCNRQETNNELLGSEQQSQNQQVVKVDVFTAELSAVGTQKTAEKMRRDEDLGDMATISAVLYANTQHPELKQMYPQWSDRCKQILKRWRSLSTEKKAPFLQHAKDNRSALRMRRTQQDQEKTCSHQKAVKELEQERIWKKYQAKAKESTANKPYAVADVNCLNDSFELEENDKRNIPRSTFLQNTSFHSSNEKSVTNTINRCENAEKSKMKEDFDNDHTQLRNLLQKTEFSVAIEASLPTNSPVKFNNSFNAVKTKSGIGRSTEELFLPKEVPEQKVLSRYKIHSKNEAVPNKVRNELKMAENVEINQVYMEKLEQDENTGIGDILGGIESDDDELLKSLTAEMGDDFNILEYADPELDQFTTNQNLLNKLDFDESDKNA